MYPIKPFDVTLKSKYTTGTFRAKPSFYEYSGAHALQLETLESIPQAKLTVNIPEAKLPEGEFWCKNYGENEGLIAAFVDAGVIEATGKHTKIGHAEAIACRYTITFLKEQGVLASMAEVFGDD